MSIDENDIFLMGAPIFHITGLVAGLALSYRTGMSMILFHRFDPNTCLELAERWKATFTVMAITAFQALMNQPEWKKRDLTSLSKVYSGGAPVAPTTASEWSTVTGHRIQNIYGLTETTSPSHAVPLDMPIGESGELWIKGPMVAMGYWNLPDVTSETFVEGFLRTGDLGFMNSDGWFFVIDRLTDIINASGYKVAPREVEEFLLQHPSVREAAVVGIPDDYRGETVKAFVVTAQDSDLTPNGLIEFSKAGMAAYKYPRIIEFVDELPKNTSGKVLRRQLRDRVAS
jgi:long-chain acyl-CoA synthetase